MRCDNKLPCPCHDDFFLGGQSILRTQCELLDKFPVCSFEYSHISVSVDFIVIELTSMEKSVRFSEPVSAILLETLLHVCDFLSNYIVLLLFLLDFFDLFLCFLNKLLLLGHIQIPSIFLQQSFWVVHLL